MISSKSTTPKFASLYFSHPEVLSYLSNKYGADLFVFITEMDIENDISDQVALANNRYKRILRIHYAIVNSDGEFIAKGVAETTFYNNVNKMEVIKSQHFPAIAEQIALKLPGMIKEEPAEINPLEKILPGKKPN